MTRFQGIIQGKVNFEHKKKATPGTTVVKRHLFVPNFSFLIIKNAGAHLYVASSVTKLKTCHGDLPWCYMANGKRPWQVRLAMADLPRCNGCIIANGKFL